MVKFVFGTSSEVFYADYAIISKASSILRATLEATPAVGSETVIKLDNLKPVIFNHYLDYLHDGKLCMATPKGPEELTQGVEDLVQCYIMGEFFRDLGYLKLIMECIIHRLGFASKFSCLGTSWPTIRVVWISTSKDSALRKFVLAYICTFAVPSPSSPMFNAMTPSAECLPLADMIKYFQGLLTEVPNPLDHPSKYIPSLPAATTSTTST